MTKRVSAAFAVGLLLVTAGFAKDKKKSILPDYVSHAHTVAVLIDPDAGVSADDPRANEVAQKDVETALLNWGRLEPVIGTQAADLIIVVRKGTGRLVNKTISDPRQNNRPGSVDPFNNGVAIGAQHGRPADSSGSGSPGSAQEAPGPETEIGAADDSFSVYEGGVSNPLDNPVAWRFVAKDGLRPHTVPAVDEFRKAMAEADKAAASKKP